MTIPYRVAAVVAFYDAALAQTAQIWRGSLAKAERETKIRDTPPRPVTHNDLEVVRYGEPAVGRPAVGHQKRGHRTQLVLTGGCGA